MLNSKLNGASFITDQDVLHRIILGHCYRQASLSPDTSTQVGSVIVNEFGYVEPDTFSHNDFCHGWIPTSADLETPRKYQTLEHSERNSVFQAAKLGIPLLGSTLYSTWGSCVDCSRAIVQSGIKKLVRHSPPGDAATDRWLESTHLGDEIMKSGGVTVVDIHGPIPGACSILRGGVTFNPGLMV